MNFLKSVQALGRVAMTLLFVLVVGIAVIQTLRSVDLKKKNDEYLAKIESHERAVLLTEELRKRNAELIQERDDLLEALQDAEGYDSPLPAGIADIVDRVRRNSDRVE